MPSIYIAGKIRDQRSTFRPLNIGVNPDEYIDHSPVRLDDFFDYTGPFAIGCDHRCYHTPEGHGAGKGGGGCNQDGPTAGVIYVNCIEQIRKADFFLAWIDSLDCFGTIVEIGYAHGLDLIKPRVFIAFDQALGEDAIKNFWFVSEFGENLGALESVNQALDSIRNRVLVEQADIEIYDLHKLLDSTRKTEDNDVPFTRFS